MNVQLLLEAKGLHLMRVQRELARLEKELPIFMTLVSLPYA